MPVFFFSTHTVGTILAVCVCVRVSERECDRGGMGVHCFQAIVQYLLNPHVLSVQLHATNEMQKRVCACAQ